MDPRHPDAAHSTKTIHAGYNPNHWNESPVVAPIYLTTTYENLEPGRAPYEYSRNNNPTRGDLEKYLAKIESAKFALTFSSGMGALTCASYLVLSGQHVLCSDDVYAGTNNFFSHCSARMGIETTFLDCTRLEEFTNNFRVGQTKLVWIESPTNPTMKIGDLAAIVRTVKSMDPECIVVVDNTFMPICQRPLMMGVDIVMHSCSNYIGGHCDFMMGALITNDEVIFHKLKYLQNALGIIPSSFDCYLAIRSIKTLHVRVERQSTSALKVAKFLQQHPRVRAVLYPGLQTHPQYAIARRDYKGFGGMMSFYVETYQGNEATKIAQECKVFHLAVSFGSVQSLIEIPSKMTHSGVSQHERLTLDITDNLIRLSIGLEDPEDLIVDLNNALNRAYR